MAQKDQPGNPLPMSIPSGFKPIQVLGKRHHRDVRGNFVKCHVCNLAGGTMVKDNKGYKHDYHERHEGYERKR